MGDEYAATTDGLESCAASPQTEEIDSTTKHGFMMTMEMLFADTINLSAEEKRELGNWPTMRRQIEARVMNGFEIHTVTVNGFSYKGGKKENGILIVLANIEYTPPGGRRGTYGVSFISDAAILLVVFRVFDKQLLDRAGTHCEHHVVLIQQARWGRNDPDCLEIPGGLIWDNETVDLNKWRNPAIEALREFEEETSTNDDHGFSLKIKPEKIESLGSAISIYPCITDQQHQFFVELDMSRAQFEAIKAKLDGRKGGHAHEGEATHVQILPLDRAYVRLLDKGTAPDAFQALARYKRRTERGSK